MSITIQHYFQQEGSPQSLTSFSTVVLQAIFKKDILHPKSL